MATATKVKTAQPLDRRIKRILTKNADLDSIGINPPSVS